MNGTNLRAVPSSDRTAGTADTRRTRRQRALAVSPLLLLVAFATGCDDEEPNVEPKGEKPSPVELAPYDARGPFVVGYRQLEAPGVDGARALRVKAWYPAGRDGAGAEPEISYELDLKPADWSGFDVLTGDADARAALSPDARVTPGLVYTTTGAR